jgi:outer membrane receptor for Fe3+-dicitrate
VVRNYEGGFKFQNDLLYADISAYFRDFTGLAYQQTNASGVPTGARLFYGSESKGVNFIGAITPGEHFRFEMVANYLDGEYTDFDACFPYTNVVSRSCASC